MKLNLGCSDNLHPAYLSVDRYTPANVGDRLVKPAHVAAGDWEGKFLQADLTLKWPFGDSSVDSILANDIIEHLPNRIRTMNEAHRVLKPGGTLEIFVPTTDGRGAFQDPTHVSYWNLNSFYYYVDVFAEWKRFHESYGITARFSVVGEHDTSDVNTAIAALNAGMKLYPGEVWKLHVTLKAVK